MPKISLAAARVNANKTQEDTAKALKVSKATVVNWENGKSFPRADKLKELCTLYNMPVEYIDI